MMLEDAETTVGWAYLRVIAVVCVTRRWTRLFHRAYSLRLSTVSVVCCAGSVFRGVVRSNGVASIPSSLINSRCRWRLSPLSTCQHSTTATESIIRATRIEHLLDSALCVLPSQSAARRLIAPAVDHCFTESPATNTRAALVRYVCAPGQHVLNADKVPFRRYFETLPDTQNNCIARV